MTNQPNAICAQHAEEIAKKFIGYALTVITGCDNAVYALVIAFDGSRCINIEFYDSKEMIQFRIEDALALWTLDQLTIIKIAPGYPSLNIRVEVVE